jgi:hypothetical protein
MDQPTRTPETRRRRRRFHRGRLLFPLIFAIVVLGILSERVPVLRDAREQLLHPATHRARTACHDAALAAAAQPAYARIVAEGEVHDTQGAQYVEGVRVGEMGPDGAEVVFEFSCYVDADGNVVKTHKQPSAS